VSGEAALAFVLKRDRLVVAAGLVATVAAGWIYLLLAPMPAMDGMETMAMGRLGGWTSADVTLTILMWAAMMVGMMVPSAAPVILLYAMVARRRDAAGHASTAALVAGYVTAWSVFSLAATLLQWGLDEAALLTMAQAAASPILGAAILMAAGVYQFLPLKHACLDHCRSPLHVVTHEWRPGRRGAFVMGVRHGAVCVGCCWALMGLLFVGGTMNLLWAAAIAVLVLAEKLLPAGPLVGRLAGLGLIAAGLALIF
jgi:predicted metal-binding membrane protein